MYVYLATLAVSALLCALATHVRTDVPVGINTLAHKNDMQKRAWLFVGLAVLSALPFLFVSGFRYDVGTDYYFTYVPLFNKLEAGASYSAAGTEPGFWLLNKVILFFGGGTVWLFLLTSLFVVGFMWAGIYQQSAYPWASIVIFVLGEGYFISMNGVRQYMALAVVFWGFRFLRQPRFWKYALCVLAGALFHTTILVFLPLYFVVYLKQKWMPLAALAAVLVASLLNSQMKRVFDFVVSKTPYGGYLGGEFQLAKRFYPYRIAIYACVLGCALLSYYFTENSKKPSFRFFLYLEMLALFLALNRNIFPLTDRFCWYFEVVQILLIPAILAKIPNKIARWAVFCALCGVLGWVAYNEIVLRLYHEVLPYQTVFVIQPQLAAFVPGV